MLFFNFKKIKNLCRKSFIFLLIFSWFFSGWSAFDLGINFIPEIKKAQAAATPGDYLIMNNDALTDYVNTSNLDATWDNQIYSNGSSISYSAGTFTLAAGKYLVMYSEHFNNPSDAANNERVEIQGRLVVGGVEIGTGAGQAYLRKQDGSSGDWQDDGIVHGSGIIEITSDDTSLLTRFYRTDNSASNIVQRYPGWGGITILALDDTWNYARYELSSNQTHSAAEGTWEDLVWGTNNEEDTGFSRSGANITISSAGRYIVSASVPISGASNRTEYNMRLTLNNTEVEGTEVSTYIRASDSCNDGVLTYVGVIDVGASDVLAVEAVQREGSGTLNYLAGSSVEILQLPSGNESIIVEATSGEMNPSTLTEFAWDSIAHIDTDGFTMSAGTDSYFAVDVTDNYLLFATQHSGNANTRTYASARFSVDDTILPYAAAGEYGRNTGTADQPGYSFGALAHNVSAGSSISLENIYLEESQLSQTVDHGAISAIRWGSIFNPVNPVTNQLHFRWRDDSTALNTNGGWLAAEDSNGISDANKGDTYRLRFEVANTGYGVEDAARTYEIQYGRGTNCANISTWTGMDNADDPFNLVDSSYITADGQVTSALLSNSEAYTFVAGEGRDVTDTTSLIGPLSIDYYTELEYSFQPTELAVTGRNYCFRLYDTTAGSTLDNYAIYPQLVIAYQNISYNNTIMEWGTQASVGDDAWTTVNFAGTYDSPVFVCTTEYNANIGNESDGTADSIVCRVQNVGATSAQVRLQEPGTLVGDTGNLTAETIHWLVVEEGTYNTGDIKMEAFTYTSTVTDGKTNNWNGQSQTLSQSYTSPVVIGQVMTTNDTGHSQFWAHNGSSAPPTNGAVYTGKHISEDNDLARADEIIGVVVIEQANGTLGSIVYEARLQTQTIDRIDDTHTNYAFNTAFNSTPEVGIISLAGVSGTDGPITSLYGSSPLSTTNIYPVIMETEIVDTEQSGNTEYVPYLVFESAGQYTISSNVAVDQIVYRFYENIDNIQPSTALANENTDLTNVANGTVFRLRMALQVGGILEADSISLKMQYGEGSDCPAIATWSDVGGIGSGAIWRGYDNTTPADGATISSSLLIAQSNVLQSYEEENISVGIPTVMTLGQEGEWDWVVQNNGATSGTDYCFRVVKASDSSVIYYSHYPKVTTAAAISISMNTDGVVAFGFLGLNTTHDTTAGDLNDVEVVSVDNGPADLDIKSSVFTEGGNTWALGSTNGSDQVRWDFASTTPVVWTNFALADILYSLDTNVLESQTRNLMLRLQLPTATASFSQYSGAVTVVASAP